MEERVMILSTPEAIAEGIEKFMEKRAANAKNLPRLEDDKLTRKQAAKLVDVSLPTLAKMIKAGIIPMHGFGRKTWFLRSEIISSLRQAADKKQY